MYSSIITHFMYIYNCTDDFCVLSLCRVGLGIGILVWGTYANKAATVPFTSLRTHSSMMLRMLCPLTAMKSLKPSARFKSRRHLTPQDH